MSEQKVKESITDEDAALLPKYSSSSLVGSPVFPSSSAQHGPDPEKALDGSRWQATDAPQALVVGPSEPNGAPEQHSFSVQNAVDGKTVLQKVDRHLLPFFFSLALLCSIDRANLSYAALQLNHDLNFSHTVYGFGSGLFFLGYMVFQVPSTYVCARVGPPKFLGAILITWGLVATLFAWMETSMQFYTLRLILGLAESGAYPGMWYSLALFYDDKELGVAYTTVAMATSVAGVLGGPIAAALLSLDGLARLRGWQWLFLLEGVPAVALGIAICCSLAHSPSRAAFLAPEERSWLIDRRSKQPVAEVATSEEEEEMAEKLRSPQPEGSRKDQPFYKNWCIWYLGIVWMLVATGLDGIVFWGPIIIHNILDNDSPPGSPGAADMGEDLQETGISTWETVQAALLSAIPFGIASICMMVNARLAKRAGERQWHVAVPLLLGAVALALMPAFMGRITWAAFTCLSLAAAGIWAVHGPLLSWPAAILQGTNAAAGFALMKMLGSVGSFCGPFLIGALADEHNGSFVPAVLLLSSLLLVASVMHLLFREPGSGQGWLPRFPYNCGRVMKRSRSDINTITLGPTLRRVFGTREFSFHRWTSDAHAFEGQTLGQQQPGVHSPGHHPAAHLLGEDTYQWEKHSELPRF